MTYQIEKLEESVKLTVFHETDMPNSKLIDGISQGWPMVLPASRACWRQVSRCSRAGNGPRGM
jgi:hypothetical protein